MPFSHFNRQGQWLEMRDSRLGDLIAYCEQFLDEFAEEEKGQQCLGWLKEAVEQWKAECRLPPGCKTIELDPWLVSPERIDQLGRFLVFVAERIRTTMPPTESIIATESERVRRFVLQPEAKHS